MIIGRSGFQIWWIDLNMYISICWMEYVSIFLGDESSRKVSWKTKKRWSFRSYLVCRDLIVTGGCEGMLRMSTADLFIRLYRWRFYVGCNMITLYVLDSYLLPTNHKLSEPGTICAQTEFKPLEGEGGKQWLGSSVANEPWLIGYEPIV